MSVLEEVDGWMCEWKDEHFLQSFFMLIPSNLNFKVVVFLPCVCDLLPPTLVPLLSYK